MAVSPILLDTNAYAAFKRGDAEAVAILRTAETIGFSAVVLGELLSGFALGNREADNRRELSEFLASPRVTLLPVTEDTAGFYARVYQGLRRKGKPIPTNDLWIAATALQHGFAVFSHDRHFAEIDGLLTGQQLADFLP
jgi:predicted nucleic acid-binding protein